MKREAVCSKLGAYCEPEIAILKARRSFSATTIGAAWLGPCDPKVHRGIRSPRAPRFGDSEKLCRIDEQTLVANRAPEFVVPKRQRVGFSKSAHRDIMRRSLCYPANGAYPRKRIFQALRRFECESFFDDSAGQRSDCPRASTANAHNRKIRFCQVFRSRKQVIQSHDCTFERSSKSPHQSSDYRYRIARCKMLVVEYGAYGKFKPIPNSRHSQARPLIEKRFQPRIP